MSQPTTRRRERMTRDSTTMRKVRRRYLRRLRSWLEADRERIYLLVDRMRELGLYAPTTSECDVRSGAIITLAKLDGHETPELKRRWLLKTGWIAYHGWSKSAARRARESA